MSAQQPASSFASAEATARFSARFPLHQSFYRQAQSLTVSTLGIGSYLGEMTIEADRNYEESVVRAVQGGINFIDTSLNYRNQHSERNIGAALRHLISQGKASRDELVICTKAGYLVRGAVPPVSGASIVGEMHCMDPGFLTDQLDRSRANLGVNTIDVMYLHNPETQLDFVSEEQFLTRVRAAFETFEQAAAAGAIRYYGMATWNGFRQKQGGLPITRIVNVAREVAGEAHRFRFVQLPFNLGMTEALTNRDSAGRNFLDIATGHGITVVASASILQARLTRNLPPVLGERLAGLDTDAQRAIQFVRSTPGITLALVGMGNPAHVDQNLGLTRVPPSTYDEYVALFR